LRSLRPTDSPLWAIYVRVVITHESPLFVGVIDDVVAKACLALAHRLRFLTNKIV
jgi:hypothetical protein